jgi:hypothetical protein
VYLAVERKAFNFALGSQPPCKKSNYLETTILSCERGQGERKANNKARFISY